MIRCILSRILRSEKSPQIPRPPFWSKTLVLVLLLAGSGCSQLNTTCQSGILGNTYDWFLLFPSTALFAAIFAALLSVGFYLLQVRKLGKWNLRTSESAPKTRPAPLFPFVIVLIPLVLILLFFGADCSNSQKGAHIAGIALGWVLGYFIGFFVFQTKTRSYKKISSNKDEE